MKILDLDMDYFLNDFATFVSESCVKRLSEEYYGKEVWSEDRVRLFLEKNLGLSKEKRIKGRIVAGHNESLFFWKDLINNKIVEPPFEIIHVDSHADLGLGYSSWKHILKNVLSYPVVERPAHNEYVNCEGTLCQEGIGDYLLFAIAYRWISRLTYCANPNGQKNDYLYCTLKNFEEKFIWDDPVDLTIQLIYNPQIDVPKQRTSTKERRLFIDTGVKEPEVPMTIIPTIEDVSFDGDFEYAVLAQSPNYTPASADFIMDIFREYIEEY